MTAGLRGSVTSTPVKFFGADSWAIHSTRRPSPASCTAIPSPQFPNPPSSSCAKSFMRAPDGASGLAEDVAVAEVGARGPGVLVGRLRDGDAVGGEGGAPIVLVQARVVLAEDGRLHRAVGRPEG